MELIVIGIIIVAILAIAFALYYRGLIAPGIFFGMFHLLDCCALVAVFGVTIVFTIGGFLLWHSLLVAALAGGSIMMTMLIVFSAVTASYNKAESQSS